MAIVEDEVRNESEEENEIEVVVEEYEGDDQDSEDSEVREERIICTYFMFNRLQCGRFNGKCVSIKQFYIISKIARCLFGMKLQRKDNLHSKTNYAICQP